MEMMPEQVLFMVSILPGFAACAYIPALVLERPLYYRYAEVNACLLHLLIMQDNAFVRL